MKIYLMFEKFLIKDVSFKMEKKLSASLNCETNPKKLIDIICVVRVILRDNFSLTLVRFSIKNCPFRRLVHFCTNWFR